MFNSILEESEMKKLMLMMVVVFLAVGSASATYVSAVTIEDVSSELAGRAPVNVINGNGFTEATGVHVSTFENDTMWLNNNVMPSYITFDLEANYDLDSVTVWNYNEYQRTGRGAKAVEISIAASEGGAFTSIGTFEFDRAPGTESNFAQVIDLTSYAAAGDARLVRFDISSNWGPEGGPADYTGLSEVRFTEVPEPATMALLGLGSLVLIRRKKA